MALGLGFGFGLQRGKSSNAALTPSAPVLTWTSATTVNPPFFSAVFDGAHMWADGQIDASNFDRIELQIDQDAAFGSPDEDATNDVDAAELLAGEVQFTTGVQVGGVSLYARARHIHYVNGGAHPSQWSNVETKILLTVRQFAIPGLYVNAAGLRQYATPGAYIIEVTG